MRKQITVALVGMVAALVAVGCGGGEGADTNAGETPAELTIAIRNDIDSFNPMTSAQETGALQAFRGLYATLVQTPAAGPEEGDVQPILAESWETTSPTSITVKLREGLECADGSAMDAKGIAKSVSAARESFYAPRIFGPGGLKSAKGDNGTNSVTITVGKPYPYLLEGLNEVYIICPAALSRKDLDKRPAPTGPYELTQSRRGESYTLTRRDDYEALPEGQSIDDLPKTIILQLVEEDTTRANLIESGEVDVTSILGRDAERVEASGSLTTSRGPGFGVDGLLFNQADGHIGADPDIRKGLSYAVDNEAYNQAATFGLGKAVDTVYTPNMDCFTEENQGLAPGFDESEALATLKKAGYTQGPDGALSKNGEPLVIRLLGYDSQNDGPDYLASALREIGAQVEVTNGTFDQWLNVLFGSGDWDVTIFPYNSPFYPPSLMVNQITGPPTGLNVGDVQNEQYVKLTTKASAAPEEQRCELWQEAERALLEDVDLKPLVWPTPVYASTGVSFSANYWYIDLNTIHAGE